MMGWFRARVRLGAWLTFAALALNLAFVFGHHHFDEVRGFTTAQHEGVARHTDDGDGDHSSAAHHPCFTCAVVSVAAFAANPPVLPVQVWPRAVAGATAAVFELR